MSFDEQETMNRVENHARSAIKTTVSHELRHGEEIPKCFSCPGDCKELSKKTK